MRNRLGLGALAVVLVAACGKGDGSKGGGAAATAAERGRDGGALADPYGALAMPAAAATVAVEPVPDGPLVVVTSAAVLGDGAEIVPLDHGAIIDGGGDAGVALAPLRAWAEARAGAGAPGDTWIRLVIEPSVPSATLVAVIGALKPLGPRFALVLRRGDAVGAVPLALPELAAADALDPAYPDRAPLRLVLSLHPRRAELWSLSGLEGTLQAPLVELERDPDGAWLARVRTALADVVRRRFSGGASRDAADRQLLVVADADVPAGDQVATLAAVRRGDDGAELFPDLLLGVPPAVAAAVAASEAAAASAAAARQDDRAALADEAARFAELLIAEGDDGLDSIDSIAGHRDPGADLAQQIAAVEDEEQRVAVGGGGGGGGAAAAAGGTSGGIVVDPPGPARHPAPSGRIKIASVRALDDSSLAGADVQRKIMAAYMAGLLRCYRHALKADPTLRGAMTLAFTVADSGRTTGAKASGVAPEVATCVDGLLSSWVFPRPTDDDGDATDATFVVELTLAPG
ncbi:MAG: AgmX/PglI C-terminal domain-containing protein [Kofleriaceae bacterium]|nr:AgmX/PglI C-terminal domain-containing protein [Kofleriaceae bacterium]